MFGSRPKGSRAELEIAKLFALWWQQLEPGCVFARTPGSGAWGRGAARADFKAGGDLTTTAKRFPWCVEVKRREGWSLPVLLAGRASPVWDWWEQTTTAATEGNLAPLMVFRKNETRADQIKRAALVAQGVTGPGATVPEWFVMTLGTDSIMRLRPSIRPSPVVQIVVKRPNPVVVSVHTLSQILRLHPRFVALPAAA